MKQLLSLLFLIIALGSTQAQIVYTETDWTATDTSYLEVRTVVEGAVTWYHLDMVSIGSNGFQSTHSITHPMLEAELLAYITAWKADKTITSEGLTKRQAFLTASETLLDDLEGSLE